MSATREQGGTSAETADARGIDMKLEVVVIPVSDVDRAKRFYTSLGWRLDADLVRGEEFRLVQFTPPGSACSIHFGTGVTAATPGSAAGLYLVVSEIETARDDLVARGIDVSRLFHRVGGDRVNGPDPGRRSYASFATFHDPDGNSWLLQEVTARLPGRVETENVMFASPAELTSALKRAEAAHAEHEKRTGQHDINWANWYAEYIAAEQAGRPLPT